MSMISAIVITFGAVEIITAAIDTIIDSRR
jgi:hypothetical protein